MLVNKYLKIKKKENSKYERENNIKFSNKLRWIYSR